jgi:hypothetical protein
LINGNDITSNQWVQQGGLLGESKQYFSPSVIDAPWKYTETVHIYEPLTWYKYEIPSTDIHNLLFDAGGSDIMAKSIMTRKYVSFSLKLSSMQKGQAYVNGYLIGRYWDQTSEADCKPCEWNGPFNDMKCRMNCGEASQEYYHVPMDYILDAQGQPRNVTIVLFEERGGDPTKVELILLL